MPLSAAAIRDASVGPVRTSDHPKPSSNSVRSDFRELRIDGVHGSSQARCSDKFAPRSRKVAKRLSSPLKFIADSLPPIIMRHEKVRNTERRAKAIKAADTWVEGTIASIPVAVDESMQL